MLMKFSDGMNIETSGDYRVIRKPDGLYVVGHGILCAVNSYEEGYDMIESFTRRRNGS